MVVTIVKLPQRVRCWPSGLIQSPSPACLTSEHITLKSVGTSRRGEGGSPGLNAMTAFLNLLHLHLVDLPEIVRIAGQERGLGQHGRGGDGAVRRFQAV